MGRNDIQTQKKNIENYQKAGIFHGLTCYYDSNHELLEPLINPDNGTLFLRCPTCGYVQVYIPDVALEFDITKYWDHPFYEHFKLGIEKNESRDSS
jgi:hypothetical protein